MAFVFAREEGKLHVPCLSEHNHESTNAELNDVESAATAATTAGIFGLQGQEYSKLQPNGGNHITFYKVGSPIPEKVDNNFFSRPFREWVPAYRTANPNAIVFCQFNHPEKLNEDYRRARGGRESNEVHH